MTGMSDLEQLEAALREQAEQKIVVARALAGSRDTLLTATEAYRKDYSAALKHFSEDELKAVGLLVDGVKPAPKTPPKRKPAQASGSKPSKTAASPKPEPSTSSADGGNGSSAVESAAGATDSTSA